MKISCNLSIRQLNRRWVSTELSLWLPSREDTNFQFSNVGPFSLWSNTYLGPYKFSLTTLKHHTPKHVLSNTLSVSWFWILLQVPKRKGCTLSGYWWYEGKATSSCSFSRVIEHYEITLTANLAMIILLFLNSISPLAILKTISLTLFLKHDFLFSEMGYGPVYNALVS